MQRKNPITLRDTTFLPWRLSQTCRFSREIISTRWKFTCRTIQPDNRAGQNRNALSERNISSFCAGSNSADQSVETVKSDALGVPARCPLCAISDHSAPQLKTRDRREWWLRRHGAALRGPACPRRTESRLGISLIRAQLMYCGSCHLDKTDWIVRPSHRERGTDTRRLILRGM